MLQDKEHHQDLGWDMPSDDATKSHLASAFYVWILRRQLPHTHTPSGWVASSIPGRKEPLLVVRVTCLLPGFVSKSVNEATVGPEPLYLEGLQLYEAGVIAVARDGKAQLQTDRTCLGGVGHLSALILTILYLASNLLTPHLMDKPQALPCQPPTSVTMLTLDKTMEKSAPPAQMPRADL